MSSSHLSQDSEQLQIDCHLNGSLTEKSANRGRCRVTIDKLPDVALLEIFECYMDQVREESDHDAWFKLVHVCQKWRSVVFGSSRRLDLQLYCTDTTPVKETLAGWPPLPIIIESPGQCPGPQVRMDNIIAALEHNDRVCKFNADVPNSQWEEVFAAMQQPFPVLTDLVIYSEEWFENGPVENDMPPVVPESFLGRSAPSLRKLYLERVPFPGLPKLLLSATELVSLYLSKIPSSGYISPDAMVHCLSTLTRLKELRLEFEYLQYLPVQEGRHGRHPPTRLALLALIDFRFEGSSEYLEELVTRMDAPLLDSLDIMFFHQPIFDTPQLAQFVARTPNIQSPINARIDFSDWHLQVTSAPSSPGNFAFQLGISRRQSDQESSSLARVCDSSFREAFTSTVERLYIRDHCDPFWPIDIEDSQWPEILRLFAAVKCLRLSRGLMLCIAPALQELAGEVLPSLEKLFLDGLHPSGYVPGAIRTFVAARKLAGRPIAVSHCLSHWDGTD